MLYNFLCFLVDVINALNMIFLIFFVSLTQYQWLNALVIDDNKRFVEWKKKEKKYRKKFFHAEQLKTKVQDNGDNFLGFARGSNYETILIIQNLLFVVWIVTFFWRKLRRRTMENLLSHFYEINGCCQVENFINIKPEFE